MATRQGRHELRSTASSARPTYSGAGDGEAIPEVRRSAPLRRALPIAIAAAVLAACGGGGEQVPSLDVAAFQEAEGHLEKMIDRGRAGDADAAEEAFEQVGGFLHQLDTALAGMPAEVTVRAELIDAGIRIEQELESERRPDVLADIAEDARRSLAEVGEALGVSEGLTEAQ